MYPSPARIIPGPYDCTGQCLPVIWPRLCLKTQPSHLRYPISHHQNMMIPGLDLQTGDWTTYSENLLRQNYSTLMVFTNQWFWFFFQFFFSFLTQYNTEYGSQSEFFQLLTSLLRAEWNVFFVRSSHFGSQNRSWMKLKRNFFSHRSVRSSWFLLTGLYFITSIWALQVL